MTDTRQWCYPWVNGANWSFDVRGVDFALRFRVSIFISSHRVDRQDIAQKMAACHVCQLRSGVLDDNTFHTPKKDTTYSCYYL